MTDSPLKKKGAGASGIPQGDFLRGVRRPGTYAFDLWHRRGLTKHAGLPLNHSWFPQAARPGALLLPPLVLSIAARVGEVLGYAHAQGVTLYQLLSGGLPFRGASLAQLMFRIANEPHPDIRAVRNGLPACVAAIINRALTKNPDQRYQSGEQMARAIRLCLATLVPASRPAVAAI